jgi:hypothetical protein
MGSGGLASPAGTGLSAALKPRFAGLRCGLPSLTQELPLGTRRGSITIASESADRVAVTG